MQAIQKIKLNCPKCEKEFYAKGENIKFINELQYGIERIVLHCICKKCKVKLELEV
jgi:hypothetical protein